MIEKKAFENVAELSGDWFKLPPRLNYINDDAFAGSDLDSLDFTGGDKITLIGSHAFSNTKLRTIDLSKHYGLSSIGAYCFSNNPHLCCVKLPGTILGLGIDAFKNTPALKTVGIGWEDRVQLGGLIENLSLQGYSMSDIQRLFKDKNLQIPIGSFEQYYRQYPDGKFLNGNFITEENVPVLTVVGDGRGIYRAKHEWLKSMIEVTTNDREKAKLKSEYERSPDHDKESNILYGINLVTRKAFIKENEFIKQIRRVTLPEKISYLGTDYTIASSPEAPVLDLPNTEIDELTVEMNHIPDEYFVFPKLHKVTLGRGVKTAGNYLFDPTQDVDVYFDCARKDVELADHAFWGSGVKLHAVGYDRNLNYFRHPLCI
ncbi:hypothetical protein Barb7_02996 [Bacteroidales bacterium Barb7]|nr:hypothetical protein Barb7_02996 [Bacteroidales bacterium Barb7]